MKFPHWIVATVALASFAPTPAPAASGGPVSLIYRFSGLYDDGGGAGGGVLSLITCSNFSAVSEDVVIAARNWDATLVAAKTYTIPPLNTRAYGTHFGQQDPWFLFDALSPGTIIFDGLFSIASTTQTISCTAMVIDGAVVAVPWGVALHAHRYNPEPGTDE